MTDKQLKKLMDKTLILAIKHRETLRLLESEYFKRFGHNPSEVDDDFFIDTFHYGNGGLVTVEQLTDNAKLYS